MLADTLKELEFRFSGGMVEMTRVQSPLDKTKQPPNNRGADKMHPKGMNYSNAYQVFLDGVKPLRLVELGVFTGVSMAVWCELYQDADIVGLDVDLNRIDIDDLERRGAFQWNTPVLFEWDAFNPQPLHLLKDVDVFIDDGPHVTEAVKLVAEFMRPRMNNGGRYIVEDMDNGGDILRQVFPEARVERFEKIACAFL